MNEPSCTCPEPAPDTGPGVLVKVPGTSHRRGCPVVADIFDTQDRIARDMAERHVARGGILPSPGEAEARRAQESVADLARRVDLLASAVTDMHEAMADMHEAMADMHEAMADMHEAITILSAHVYGVTR